MLVAGDAVLEIEGQDDVALQAGDYLFLPAHVRHRVKEVSDSIELWEATDSDPVRPPDQQKQLMP